jgi:hypothetical protein
MEAIITGVIILAFFLKRLKAAVRCRCLNREIVQGEKA